MQPQKQEAAPAGEKPSAGEAGTPKAQASLFFKMSAPLPWKEGAEKKLWAPKIFTPADALTLLGFLRSPGAGPKTLLGFSVLAREGAVCADSARAFGYDLDAAHFGKDAQWAEGLAWSQMGRAMLSYSDDWPPNAPPLRRQPAVDEMSPTISFLAFARVRGERNWANVAVMGHLQSDKSWRPGEVFRSEPMEPREEGGREGASPESAWGAPGGPPKRKHAIPTATLQLGVAQSFGQLQDGAWSRMGSAYPVSELLAVASASMDLERVFAEDFYVRQERGELWAQAQAEKPSEGEDGREGGEGRRAPRL